MAENTPLGTVLKMVRAQVAYPADPTINTAEDQRFYQLIDDKQKWLADEWDWPTLEEWWDVQIGPGVRYSAIPTAPDRGPAVAFNKRRPLITARQWNAYWDEVPYGIEEFEQYNNVNSDQGQTQDPIQRWAYNDTTSFEVWPVPASNQVFRFRGQRIVNTLQTAGVYDPTKTLDLDDEMVTLFVAADYLQEQESPLWQTKLQAAMRQMDRVRACEPRYERRYVMGSGGDNDRRIKRASFKIVAVHS